MGSVGFMATWTTDLTPGMGMQGPFRAEEISRFSIFVGMRRAMARGTSAILGMGPEGSTARGTRDFMAEVVDRMEAGNMAAGSMGVGNTTRRIDR